MPNFKIVPVDNLESRIKHHEYLMTTTEQDTSSYKSAIENIMFNKGRKVILEVEITDEYLSSNLYDLLHDKIEGREFLGFKVMAIGFNPDAPKTQVLNEITSAIKQLENIKAGLMK